LAQTDNEAPIKSWLAGTHAQSQVNLYHSKSQYSFDVRCDVVPRHICIDDYLMGYRYGLRRSRHSYFEQSIAPVVADCRGKLKRLEPWWVDYYIRYGAANESKQLIGAEKPDGAMYAPSSTRVIFERA